MKQDVITLKDLSLNANVNVEYSDDDIVMIDSVNKLAAPTKARLNMNTLVLITKGKVKCLVDNEELELSANQLAICPPNLGFSSDIMSSPDFEFKGVFFTNRILQSFLREKIYIWDDLVYSHHIRIINLSEKHIKFYKLFTEMLWNCLENGRNNPYFNEIIQNLFRTVFLGLSGELKLMKSQEPQDDGKAYDRLFRQFLNLLSGINIKHRNTSYYADKLFVSPKHLSNVCKKNSGKTASEWINERLKEEVRFNLEETDISIKQICYNLGFSSTSFFGKYVRANFGKTPLQLRSIAKNK